MNEFLELLKLIPPELAYVFIVTGFGLFYKFKYVPDTNKRKGNVEMLLKKLDEMKESFAQYKIESSNSFASFKAEVNKNLGLMHEDLAILYDRQSQRRKGDS